MNLPYELIAGMSPFLRMAWGAVLLVILAGIALALRAEKRWYGKLGLGGSWLGLRLAAIPIVALTAAAVVLPARGVSGMEALAVFYGSLFLLGPVLWFGLHWLVGRMMRPRLTGRQSTTLAASGLALLLAPFILISLLQGPLFLMSHRQQQQSREATPPGALPYGVAPVRHFRLGEAGDIYTQALRAPAGVRTERVELLVGAHWADTGTMMNPSLCRQDNDIHLAWPAGATPPALRVFWHDAAGELRQAQYRVDTAGIDALPAEPFTVGWREDGFDLPVALSRAFIWLGWRYADGPISYRGTEFLQPGETATNNCIGAGYRRVEWRKEGPVQGVMMRFYPPHPLEQWGYEALREAPAPPGATVSEAQIAVQ